MEIGHDDSEDDWKSSSASTEEDESYFDAEKEVYSKPALAEMKESDFDSDPMFARTIRQVVSRQREEKKYFTQSSRSG